MRIIAGRDGGRALRGLSGRATRPTSDRVKEALFSRLDHEDRLEGARVADLYAGSGALGLEAASRGAAHVLLVDAAAPAVAACRANVKALTSGDVVQVRAGKVATVLAEAPTQPYDLVLADPPYDVPTAEVDAVLRALVDRGWLAADALVVVERSTRTDPPAAPPGLSADGQRRYGETTLWFFTAETD